MRKGHWLGSHLILRKVLLLFWLTIAQCHADDQDTMLEISARLEKFAIIQGDFSQQKNLKFLHKPFISTGTFTYHQYRGLIWQTREPVVSLLVMDDSRLFAAHEAQNVPDDFAKLFKAMLSGDFAALTDRFNMTATNHKYSWQIALTPKADLLQKMITSISLAGDSNLRSLSILEPNGNNALISFSNITHPTELTPEQAKNFERLSPP